MHRLRPTLAALALPLCLLARPAAAQEAESAAPADSAEARKEAEARYKRALELFNEGSYDAALAEFKRAYALAPTYRLLYNIALVNVELNDYAAALDAFERYLAEGGDEVPKARRQEVERQLEKLRPRVGFLTIKVDEAGSQVWIDEVSVGTTPLPERLRVNPGRRRVAVTNGERRQDRVVEVAGGDTLELDVQIAPSEGEAPPPVPAAAPPPAPPPAPAPAHKVPWVAWGITGALAAGAVTTGIVALNAHGQQTDLKETYGTTRSELDDAESKVKTWALVSDVLTAATVVGAGVSLYLTLKPASHDGETAGRTTLVIQPRGVTARVCF